MRKLEKIDLSLEIRYEIMIELYESITSLKLQEWDIKVSNVHRKTNKRVVCSWQQIDMQPYATTEQRKTRNYIVISNTKMLQHFYI